MQSKKLKYYLKEASFYIILILIVVLIRTSNILTINIVNGTSMYPTLHENSVTIGTSILVWSDDIERGDVVTIDLNGEKIIKRVIGLPGDHIEVDLEENATYVNGEKIEEDYVVYDLADGERIYYPDVTLGEDQYYVMGDYRANSLDSRYVGPINKDQLLSKIILGVKK